MENVLKEVKVAVDKNISRISIDLLTPLQGELKVLTEDNYKKLKKSILELDFSFPLNVYENPQDAKIYIEDGHQRYYTLLKMRGEGYSIPQIPVNFIEAKDFNQAKLKLLAAASQYGTYNQDGLQAFASTISNIDTSYLTEHFQMPTMDFSNIQFLNNTNEIEVSGHTRIIGGDNYEINNYSDKIQTPIYEPIGEKPNINELIDLEKYKSLCNEIEQSNLSYEEKQFMLFSATRHIVFNYEKIANYYAHSGKTTQELFENSALVIVDFNKAVQNGFVKLTNEINESYINNQQDDYENDDKEGVLI